MKNYNTNTGTNFDFQNFANIIELQTMEQIKAHRENLIENFKTKKSLSNLQKCKNAGLQAKVLINGKFEPLTEFTDDFNEYHNAVPLYDLIFGEFTLTGMGFYKKIDR